LPIGQLPLNVKAKRGEEGKQQLIGLIVPSKNKQKGAKRRRKVTNGPAAFKCEGRGRRGGQAMIDWSNCSSKNKQKGAKRRRKTSIGQLFLNVKAKGGEEGKQQLIGPIAPPKTNKKGAKRRRKTPIGKLPLNVKAKGGRRESDD